MGVTISELNISINDFNVIICTIIEKLLIAFFVLSCLIYISFLNSNKKKYSVQTNSLLLISSVVYYVIFSKFCSSFAIIYFILASIVLLIDYINYVCRLIINDEYNDSVISLIFVIMALIFIAIKYLSNTKNILFLWFEVAGVILFFLIDVYYLMYLLNKILYWLHNTKFVIAFNDYFGGLLYIPKIVLGFVSSPVLILEKLYLIINYYFYNKSILCYLQGFIAFSSTTSFIIVYVLARHIFYYSQNDIDMYVIFVTAIIIPILLLKK